MENQAENENVTWLIEELDNGITIEDKDTLAKVAAVEGSDPDSKKEIKILLGEWFYNELCHAFSQLQTANVSVTLYFEENL